MIYICATNRNAECQIHEDREELQKITYYRQCSGFFLLVEEEGGMAQKKLLLCLESGHCLQWLTLNAYANKMLL